MYDIYKKECMYIVFCTKIIKYSMLKKGKLWNIIKIYPVSEGYLRKIPVERRQISQAALAGYNYLFNSAEYLTASKTVACK
jgi:hypothetical protein